MGRQLKRVPLDFKWPQKQIWKGYLNPYSAQDCKSCEQTGLSKVAKDMQDEWYGFDLPILARQQNRAWQYNLTTEDIQALLDEDRLWDFTRVPLNEAQKKKSERHPNGWLKKSNGYVPTPEEVNEWATKGIGHDSLNCWTCIKARCEREGVAQQCEFCEGEGFIWQSEKVKKQHDKWNSFEPPAGEGYQLWETTTEGSPTSPVFESLDALCGWCEDNATTFGSYKASKEQWMAMLSDDFVYSKQGNAVFL